MGFNKFILIIILRSLILAANAIVIAFIPVDSNWLFTLLFLCLVFILQVFLLIKYLTKINRDLSQFLVHIKEQNTTLAFSKNTINKTFGNLSHEFDKINQEVKKINAEKIKKQNLLNLVLNQVGTGILVTDKNHQIQITNQALQNLFGLSNMNHNVLQKEIIPLFKNFEKIKPGEQSIETFRINKLTRKILISLSEIKEDNHVLKLYTFHDIDREITDYELQSWNGLIKVLSHEIMNTITPISTVTDTIKECLTTENRNKELSEINLKDIQDSVKGITLIENRIRNLSEIISQFRQFSDLSNPVLEKVFMNDFLNNIVDVYKTQNPQIDFKLEINPKDLIFEFDSKLTELTVNNLIKNAIEATLDKKIPRIHICAYSLKNKAVIEFIDNGIGIDSNLLEKIFLPFYTTKENGSGIGLSLAQQIMYSHKGNIEISSESDNTSVKLIFCY